MSSGLYSGVSGLALGAGLYRDVSGLWGGASGFINGFGTSYSPEAAAYFAAMSVQPSDARKAIINTCINAIVAAGVWAKLDWLSLMAAHDAQAARLNAINPAQAMTAVNAPTFTTDRGYTGDGATSYLDTSWNPTTASSPKFAQNSAYMGVWCGTGATNATTKAELGNTRSAIRAFYQAVPNVGVNINTASVVTATLASGTAIGWTSWVRTGASAHEAFRNGASRGTGTTASAAPSNGSFLVGALNTSTTGTVTPTSYSDRRVQAVAWGQQLSAAEDLALYNALNTYMTAVGA